MAIPTRFWLWSSCSNKSAPKPSNVYVLDVAPLSGSKVNTLYKFNATPRQSNPGPQLALVAGTCTVIDFMKTPLFNHDADHTTHFSNDP